MKEEEFDALALPIESVRRSIEATAWAVALAAPGLFAGLGQVDKLFRASRVPWAFGYLFGAMTLVLLLSIYLGLRNYTTLHSTLSVHNAIQSSRAVRRARQQWVMAEWEKADPDLERIREYDEKIRLAFEDAAEQFELLETLQAQSAARTSLHQRNLLGYAYLLFILIVLTSDFARLL